jgi:eukaryotic-like serine/threonine-protein kinase
VKPRWPDVERVFARAVELPATERAAYIDDACAGDAALRDEVVSLLANTAGARDALRATIIAAASAIGDPDDDR